MKIYLAVSFAAMLAAGAAAAQTTNRPASPVAPASPGTGSVTGSSNNAINAPGTTGTVAGSTTLVKSSALERGANSFTEGEARSRLERAGLQNVSGLKKDDQGIWRGKAMHNGKNVTVGLDYKGNMSAE